MSDPTPPTVNEVRPQTPDPTVEVVVTPPTLDGEFAALVTEAAKSLMVGLEPLEAGRMLAIRHPDDWTVTTLDRHEIGERPAFVAATHVLASVDSFCRYVTAHRNGAATTVWLASGSATLGATLVIAEAVLDDQDPTSTLVARRAHRARLTLEPTEAARRWANALGAAKLSQAQFVDLAIDGIAEIASPAGADLRDVVLDLQATRTSAARSVVPSGGAYRVAYSENVDLAAGAGSTIGLPDRIEIVVRPWRGVEHAMQLTVRVRPNVGDDGKVTFQLTCAALPDEMASAARFVGHAIESGTGITPYETRTIG